MSTTPSPTPQSGNQGLAVAVQILQLVNALEPAAVQLIMNLLQNLQGKTTAEILAEADSVWSSVAETAKQELGITPPPPPATPTP